jgi:hypothetical protein
MVRAGGPSGLCIAGLRSFPQLCRASLPSSTAASIIHMIVLIGLSRWNGLILTAWHIDREEQ